MHYIGALTEYEPAEISHGLGGNARSVRAILGTRLAANFEHEDFWTTVLGLFINNPTLDRHRIRADHRLLPPPEVRPAADFRCSCPGAVDRSSGDVRVWRSTELTSTRALIAEGREMAHYIQEEG